MAVQIFNREECCRKYNENGYFYNLAVQDAGSLARSSFVDRVEPARRYGRLALSLAPFPSWLRNEFTAKPSKFITCKPALRMSVERELVKTHILRH